MIILVFVTLLTLLAVYKGKFIRKHNVKLYIGTTIFGVIAFIMQDKVKVFDPFMEGFVGLSFFYIVMVTGALKDKSKLKIKLAGIRREYSIIGFILITPHATKYLLEYLQGDISLELPALISYGIMIPLFITSFYSIRKKMSRNAWVQLQRLAYISYIFLFLHLFTIADNPNKIIYIVLFIPYFAVKIYREAVKFNNKKAVLVKA